MESKKVKMLTLEEYLELDKDELETTLKKLIKDKTRQDKRIKTIIKQSDKQQFEIMKLHDELSSHKDMIEELHTYDVQQQEIALAKIETNIVNELDDDDSELCVETIFVPSDIMSGDFYSLFKRADGSIVFYVIDGQGHGISPALTVFAASSIIARFAKEELALQELLDTVLPYIRNILSDEEQLSFTIVELDSTFTKLSYSNGGMYPMFLKDGEDILTLKANTLPMMNFSQHLDVKTVEIKDFKNLMVYSDGIVEVEDEKLLAFAPRKLLEDANLFKQARKDIPTFKRDDDVTLVSISKS